MTGFVRFYIDNGTCKLHVRHRELADWRFVRGTPGDCEQRQYCFMDLNCPPEPALHPTGKIAGDQSVLPIEDATLVQGGSTTC